MRWTDEDNLTISPYIFIKIAEERGFVHGITRLVVGCVLADCQYLREHPEFRINVNIAASDLTDPAFQSMPGAALSEAKISPHSIAIEVAERTTAKRKEAIARLRRRGHSVHIDDFGTEYSSLAYLRDSG